MLKLVVGKRSWDSYISEMKLSFSLVSIAISTASEKHICKRLMLCTYAVHEALVSLFVRKRLVLRPCDRGEGAPLPFAVWTLRCGLSPWATRSQIAELSGGNAGVRCDPQSRSPSLTSPPL